MLRSLVKSKRAGAVLQAAAVAPARTRVVVDAFRLVATAGKALLVFVMVTEFTATLVLGFQFVSIQRIVDRLDRQDTDGAQPWVLALALALAASALLATLGAELRLHLSELTARHGYGRLLDVAGAVEVDRFDDPEFLDRFERVAEYGYPEASVLTWSVVGLFSGIAGLLTAGAVLVSIAPFVAAAIVVGFVPLLLIGRLSNRDTVEVGFSMAQANRERAALRELLASRTGAKELMVYGSRAPLRARYDELARNRGTYLATLARRRVGRAVVAQTGVALTAVAAGWLLLREVRVESVTLGGAAVAVLATQQLLARVRAVADALLGAHQSSLFLADFFDFIAIADASAAAERADRTVVAHQSGPQPRPVEVRGVSFTYPGSTIPALSDVSFRLPQQGIVAIVGPNGSGKSTLAKLICGLYAPDQGAVLFGGQDIRSYPPAHRFERVAVMFQDHIRYPLTAQANIDHGRVNWAGDMARVIAASRQAETHDLVSALPDGYATRLSREFEGGTDLSVGQWQRIALARTIFRSAELVVLDEPTAALDPAAEHRFVAELRTIFADSTVVVISHRLSSIADADETIVLEDGLVTQRGTHATLAAQSGWYAEAFLTERS